MGIPYHDWRCDKTFDLYYECPCCKKDPVTCEHKHVSARWHYCGSDLVNASGFCYDCGKDLKLNAERNKLE